MNAINGWDRLILEASKKWEEYFYSNPSSLAKGVASGLLPSRIVMNLGSAMLDLVRIPVKQYQKDGRLLFGFQKAASSFVNTFSVETTNVAIKVVVGTRVILISTKQLISSDGESGSKSIYADQPRNFGEGLKDGYECLAFKVGNAVYTMITAPIEAYEKDGLGSAIKTTISKAPSAILDPVIGLTEATTKVLIGALQTINPASVEEMEQKYGGKQKNKK